MYKTNWTYWRIIVSNAAICSKDPFLCGCWLLFFFFFFFSFFVYFEIGNCLSNIQAVRVKTKSFTQIFNFLINTLCSRITVIHSVNSFKHFVESSCMGFYGNEAEFCWELFGFLSPRTKVFVVSISTVLMHNPYTKCLSQKFCR